MNRLGGDAGNGGRQRDPGSSPGWRFERLARGSNALRGCAAETRNGSALSQIIASSQRNSWITSISLTIAIRWSLLPACRHLPLSVPIWQSVGMEDVVAKTRCVFARRRPTPPRHPAPEPGSRCFCARRIDEPAWRWCRERRKAAGPRI